VQVVAQDIFALQEQTDCLKKCKCFVMRFTPKNIPNARIFNSGCKKPYENMNLATKSPGSYRVKPQGVSSDQSTKT